MHWVYRLFVLGLWACPAFLIRDDLVARGVLTLYATILLVLTAVLLRPGESRFLWGAAKPVAFAAAALGVWILIQLAPIPANWLQVTGVPSGAGATQSITVSPPNTVVAFSRWFCAFAMLAVAAAVSIDRQRAERLLLSLAVLVTILPLILIGHDLGGFFFLGELSSTGPRATLTGAAVLGTIVNLGLAEWAFERYETRHKKPGFNRRATVVELLWAAFGLLVAWAALVFFGARGAIFAAAVGSIVFALVASFRRIGVERRMAYLVAAIAIAVPLAVIGRQIAAAGPDLTLRFASYIHPDVLRTMEQMLEGAPALGIGAGSFAAFVAPYSISGPSTLQFAPTTAAGLSLELGRIVTFLLLIGSVALAVYYMRGALQRGRDSFYAAVAAGAVFGMLAESFSDASLFTSTILYLALTVAGVGLSQIAGRSVR